MHLARAGRLPLLLAKRQILARYAGSLVLALLLETGRRNRSAVLNPLGHRFLRVLDVARLILLFGKARFSFDRSEEHTSELQSLMRISYAVFCLKKKKYYTNDHKILF